MRKGYIRFAHKGSGVQSAIAAHHSLELNLFGGFAGVGTVGVLFCSSAWLPKILLGAAEAPLTNLLWVWLWIIVSRMVWPRLPRGHSLKELLHKNTQAKA